MFDKISVYKIIKSHIQTLRSFNEDRLMKRDFFLFYIAPALFGCALVYKNIYLSEGVITNLIAAMSIFAGFLFNLLAIVYSLVDKIKASIKDDRDAEIKKKLLSEVLSNISYTIIISVLLVVLLITALFLPICKINNIRLPNISDLKLASLICFISIFIHTSIYLFLTNFILTLLMILQRVHILMRREIAD